MVHQFVKRSVELIKELEKKIRFYEGHLNAFEKNHRLAIDKAGAAEDELRMLWDYLQNWRQDMANYRDDDADVMHLEIKRYIERFRTNKDLDELPTETDISALVNNEDVYRQHLEKMDSLIAKAVQKDALRMEVEVKILFKKIVDSERHFEKLIAMTGEMGEHRKALTPENRRKLMKLKDDLAQIKEDLKSLPMVGR